jgi:hypothetical protein
VQLGHGLLPLSLGWPEKQKAPSGSRPEGAFCETNTVNYRFISVPSRARAADDEAPSALRDENCEMKTKKNIGNAKRNIAGGFVNRHGAPMQPFGCVSAAAMLS